MEKNIAILMADLSGYSALTETHGPVTAADLIDRYIQIAENCLVGDSRMHERRGDEIMIVSNSPEDLLATALKLEVTTAYEENFLRVHGGLHYGKVLKRGDSFFGSTINLVSRIATKAAAGTFLCSVDFINSITDKSICTFISKGKYQFKNINESKEVFELTVGKKRRYIDPVCQMLIQNTQTAIRQQGHIDHYFCSLQCLEFYKENHAFLNMKQQLN